MAVLVVADHDNMHLGEATARTLAAARTLAQEIDVLIAGRNVSAVAEAAAALEGVRTVLVADDPTLEHQLAEAMADVVLVLAETYDSVLFAATATGKSCAPRVAALLDVSSITDVIKIMPPDTFVRPIYAGNALETVQSSDRKKILTIRSSAFRPVNASGHAAMEKIAVVTGKGRRAALVAKEVVKCDRPELTSAKIVVSGGRAFGSAEEFNKVLEPLANSFGAAIGASRAAVDAGYAANNLQVGQTGKVIAPELYIAIGISGAIQHLAGIKDSKIIVAINKDAEAPIFEVADFGLVADYQSAVPELLAALDAVRR